MNKRSVGTIVNVQMDGAGNFSGTATMISLPRTFSSRKVQLVRAMLSEVGDGKNLVDTDFQQVEPLRVASFSHRKQSQRCGRLPCIV